MPLFVAHHSLPLALAPDRRTRLAIDCPSRQPLLGEERAMRDGKSILILIDVEPSVVATQVHRVRIERPHASEEIRVIEL